GASGQTQDWLQLENDTGRDIVRFGLGARDTPIMVMSGANGAWSTGIDTAAPIPSRDWFLAKVTDPVAGTVHDFLYCSHNGDAPASLGIGYSGVDASFRCQILPDPATMPSQGGLKIVAPRGMTGDPLLVASAGGTPVLRLQVDGTFTVSPGGVPSFSVSNG